MKNCLVILLAGWAIGVAMPAFAQQKDTVDPKVAREIDALGKLAEAINKNDADAVAAVFTEDAVCVTPQGPIHGREAIKEHRQPIGPLPRFSRVRTKKLGAFTVNRGWPQRYHQPTVF